MKTLLILIPLLLTTACSTATKSGESRLPSSAASFDELPTCSRIKYFYSKPGKPVGQLGREFDYRAIQDAKTIWEAAQMLKHEGGPKCVVTEIRDLVEKPRDCELWNGPYLRPEMLAEYHSMSREDLAAFLTCWQ